MEKSKFKRASSGIKLLSIGCRNIGPIEFEEINDLELRYIYLRANVSSKSPELLNHLFESTSMDALSDDSPSKLYQTIYFFLDSVHPGHGMPEATIKLQKMYKSYRTRRNLHDCAVIVQELWWKALDFASLNHSSISFFSDGKPEEIASRWARARTRAAKVGKGLSKSDKAQQLSLQHWLEAIDPKHRYGHNLQFYYDIWFESESNQPFFYWLDVGDGKDVNLEKCPRRILQKQCIQYLGPKERKAYEVAIKEGKFIYKLTELPVHTPDDEKWIFVLSTCGALFVGQKKKGKFQHSSFLAGGATTCAGRLVLQDGFIKAIWPHSGHYLPTKENFKEFINFLKENNVDLTNTKTCYIGESDRSLNHSSSFNMSRNHNMDITMETEALVLVESTFTGDHEELAKNHSNDEFNHYL